MKPTLWEHQFDAVNFLRKHPAAMLAMDMGTGKSRCIVEAVRLLGSHPSIRHLIVCPRTVLSVWEPEFRKFYPKQISNEGNPDDELILTTLDKKQTAKKKVESLRKLDDRYTALGLHAARVLVVNYETAIRPEMLAYLSSVSWDLVVLDESHRIKSASGRTSKAMAKLRARRRVCLTGTPMPHSPLDIFAQARFLDPNIFGRYWTRFRAEYARMGGYCVNGRPVQVLGYKNLDRLEKKCADFTFQVRADEVLELPDKHHVVRECPLTPKQQRDYKTLEKDFVMWLEEADTSVVASNVLDRLGKLMQYTSGHARYDDDRGNREVSVVHTAKQDALQEILEDLPSDEPMVVFSLFTPDLDAIARAAEAAGRRCLRLSGGHNDLKEWQDATDGSVLAVQIQAGGVGISLVRARYCCYYSAGFNLGNYESLARIYRPGQERKVVYYHLTVPDSVDEKVYSALSEKKNIVDEVMKNVESVKS